MVSAAIEGIVVIFNRVKVMLLGVQIFSCCHGSQERRARAAFTFTYCTSCEPVTKRMFQSRGTALYAVYITATPLIYCVCVCEEKQEETCWQCLQFASSVTQSCLHWLQRFIHVLLIISAAYFPLISWPLITVFHPFWCKALKASYAVELCVLYCIILKSVSLKELNSRQAV